MEAIKKTYRADLKEFSEGQNMLFSHITQLMLNLALIAGTLAAGSLVLVGVTNVVNSDAVVVGASILMAEVFLIFLYFFHQHGVSTKEFIKNRKDHLDPPARLILLCDKYLSKEITGDDFDKELLVEAQKVKNNVTENNKKLLEGTPGNYWDSLFVCLFGIGVVLIVWGLISNLHFFEKVTTGITPVIHHKESFPSPIYDAKG